MDESNEIAPGVIAREGKPYLAGCTDVSVTSILRELAAGVPAAKIAKHHSMSRENVKVALNYALDIMTDEVEIATHTAWLRAEAVDLAPGVVANKHIRFGKPTVRGRRVDVLTVLGQLAAGDSVEDVAQGYKLDQHQIGSVLNHAADVIESETVVAATH